MDVTEAKAQVEARSGTLVTVRREAVTLDAARDLTVRRVGSVDVKINLPQGWMVTEVDGAVDQWSEDAKVTPQVLTVKLKQQT